MNGNIREQISYLIQDIKEKITIKNIDIYTLCQKIYMPIDSFFEVLDNPQNNASLYLEILEVIEDM